MTGIACNGTRASFTGTGKANDRSVTFFVYVEDNGEPGRNDVFRIRWTGGDSYSAGGTLAGGNIEVYP